MKIFNDYSRYYNLLYKDKDYSSEANYVIKLIKKYGSDAKNILDLGCGTGKHDYFFLNRGYSVVGVDCSSTMIDIAKQEINNKNFSIYKGDIRKIRLKKKFDAIISLFHVLSYQTSNEDVINTFKTAKLHLKPKGIFIFDCWYGPTVIAERPEYKIKQFEDGNIKVIRECEPKIYAQKNIVDINYKILVLDKKNGRRKKMKEIHKMRYFFTPEIDHLLSVSGLSLIRSGEWLTGRRPDFNTFSVYFIAKNK